MVHYRLEAVTVVSESASSEGAAAPPESIVSADPGSPSFGLGGGELLATGLQRVALEQLDYAIKALTEMRPDVGIHEARKSLRRVRAMLRLVRAPLGERTYFTENRALRDAGRLIGGARDATVMVETVTALSLQYQDVLVDGAFDVLGAHLLERDSLIRQSVSSDQVDTVVIAVRAARDRFSVWPGSTAKEGGFDEEFTTIAGGLQRVYRRGRNRMADAYQAGTPEAFHEWRKRVRYLRFQMTLLKGMWPRVQTAIVKDLAALADALGTMNDLVELDRLLDREPQLLPDENARQVLQGLLVHNRTRLQEEARPVGARLFAERPAAFVGRMERYWEVWRPAGGPRC